MKQKIANTIALLTGIGMIFLGTRFLLSPEIAETGYGIHFEEHANYSFHYIKGIRDLFSGIVICIFIVTRQTKALGITLLAGTIIPVADLLIVLSESANGTAAAMPHISAIVACAVAGAILLFNKSSKTAVKQKGYIKLIKSAQMSDQSILELNILPAEKTPWHFHNLFSETFEIITGTLEVGKGSEILQLKQGDIATIQPNEKHYYHNTSNEECVISVTVNPGNQNFEKSLFILKGLAQDGLASVAGTPKKFLDLAIFVYLSNSRMLGLQKIAEPLFKYVAGTALKSGYMDRLVARYAS